MAILSCVQKVIGAEGVKPREWAILTDDTFATVTTSGYLTSLKGSLSFESADYAQVYTTDLGTVELTVDVASNGTVSLEYNLSPITGTLVNGNLIKATGTSNKITDAGYNIKSATTAAYAGGGTSNAFVATGLTATSIVTASIVTSTNAVSIAKVVPSANTLTVTFTADPGANTTVNWIATSVAVA